MEIGSNLIPYVGPEEFEKMVQEDTVKRTSETQSVFSDRYQFSGKYGANLMQEVSRYAIVASVIAQQMTYDVIHAHDWLTYAAGIAAKKVSGKPLVVHVHATEFDRSGENVNQTVYELERQGMEEADLVITVSNLTRQIVIERYGINPDKVITVHNAVEPPERPEMNDVTKHVREKVVTFLGRVTFQKGPDYFIEAANKVLKKDPNVRFVMAGSGDLLNKMIRRAAQLHIATKFHFTGFLSGTEVDTMFAMSDVYVMPSVSEPFGISPLEAMRSNVPVVISKQSGVSEVLKHALKVDFWDIDALADAIYGLLHYEGLKKMFVKYGKEEVDNLKWDNAAAKVIEVYNLAQTL
jgi:glycosyltransferase involved in cell wall biosynthesis